MGDGGRGLSYTEHENYGSQRWGKTSMLLRQAPSTKHQASLLLTNRMVTNSRGYHLIILNLQCLLPIIYSDKLSTFNNRWPNLITRLARRGAKCNFIPDTQIIIFDRLQT